MTARVVDRRIATGFLTPVHRGVFVVGWPVPTERGRWRAALDAGGPASALSHRTAGELFGVMLAGWRVTRVTWADVHRRPGNTVDRVRALLAQHPLDPAPGPSAARLLDRPPRG